MLVDGHIMGEALPIELSHREAYRFAVFDSNLLGLVFTAVVLTVKS